ncbi:MAG: HIT family protein [Ignavibacteria bacterium]|nr:HIT family protein [Ignavibacteria bacterium]
MNDCIFCRIINREVPAEVVFESDSIIAFLDINPLNYGHVLVVPKIHSNDFLDIPIDLLDELVHVTRKITKAIVDSLSPDGFNIFSNNGKAAGQSVFHFHFHVTPRYKSDNFKFIINLKKYKDGEMSNYAQKIRNQIN